MAEMLYPEEDLQVERHSSIDQFKGFLSVYKKGGWAPIVFDQLDGISCETVKTHPVVISFGGDLGYVYPEAHCTYVSDHYVTVDKYGVETAVLPKEFGGAGEFYEYRVNKRAFVNFDSGDSLGVRNSVTTRTGLSYVRAAETLPAVE